MAEPPEGCPYVERCPMFPLFRSQGALKTYQAVYCHGTYSRCERYKLASTGGMPAPSLLPDGTKLPPHWLDPDPTE